jgi:hypothetical protein
MVSTVNKQNKVRKVEKRKPIRYCFVMSECSRNEDVYKKQIDWCEQNFPEVDVFSISGLTAVKKSRESKELITRRKATSRIVREMSDIVNWIKG